MPATDLLRAFRLKQGLQVCRRGLELVLGQANHYWLSELEKAPALASIGGCEAGSPVYRTKPVVDFKMERTRDRLGAELLSGVGAAIALLADAGLLANRMLGWW